MEPNKLPEGRKPLPDEWFKERADMQERIKELEAKLAKATDVALRLYYGAGVVTDDMHATLAELTGGKDE